MHLAILTPIYKPATGGAATYYSLLGSMLIANRIVERVTVITERMPGESHDASEADGSLRIMRVFPYRASSAAGWLRQRALYLVQNLLYYRLPAIVKSLGVDVLLVHSSFHNQFNLLGGPLRLIQKHTRLVADVRDCQMPAAKLSQLEPYTQIIACSENVYSHLATRPSLSARVHTIPIPQADLPLPDTPTSEEVVRELGCDPERYLLAVGLLKSRKGVDLLLDAYVNWRAQSGQSFDLVLVGTIRDKALARRARRAPGVRLLGAVARTRLLALMKHAALNVNLSLSEGMPRASLEALALQTRVILPAGIPEFRRHCLPWVAVSTTDAKLLAQQFREALAAPPPLCYPLNHHSPSMVVKHYIEVLRARPDGPHAVLPGVTVTIFVLLLLRANSAAAYIDPNAGGTIFQFFMPILTMIIGGWILFRRWLGYACSRLWRKLNGQSGNNEPRD